MGLFDNLTQLAGENLNELKDKVAGAADLDALKDKVGSLSELVNFDKLSELGLSLDALKDMASIENLEKLGHLKDLVNLDKLSELGLSLENLKDLVNLESLGNNLDSVKDKALDAVKGFFK